MSGGADGRHDILGGGHVALDGARAASSTLLNHLADRRLGNHSDSLHSAVAATSPTQVAFNGAAEGLNRMLAKGFVTLALLVKIGACGRNGDRSISYRGYRFPPDIIQRGVWLYLRFSLSFRDVEELLAERGVVVSFRNHPPLGCPFRATDCRRPASPAVSTARDLALRRDGGVDRRQTDVSLARRRCRGRGPRGAHSAEARYARCRPSHAPAPEEAWVRADGNRHGSPPGLRCRVRALGVSALHIQGKRKNNRAESSHVPTRRRERRMQGFRSPGAAQRFLSTHAAVYNTFNLCRHLVSAKTHRRLRTDAIAVWRSAAGVTA
jgi:putative transposase